MFERPKAGQQAVLVHLDLPGGDYEADRLEFIELARAAGAEVGALLARAVKAEHDTTAGDAELADVAKAVTALVSKAPAYPRG